MLHTEMMKAQGKQIDSINYHVCCATHFVKNRMSKEEEGDEERTQKKSKSRERSYMHLEEEKWTSD